MQQNSQRKEGGGRERDYLERDGRTTRNREMGKRRRNARERVSVMEEEGRTKKKKKKGCWNLNETPNDR